MRSRSRQQGFSLIELLTVIAIIAILAGIIFPVMNSVKQRAQMTKCMSNLKSVQTALKMYRLDNRQYPDHICPLSDGTSAFDRFAASANNGAIMGDYGMKTAAVFRCPTSKITDYKQTCSVPPLFAGGTPMPFYAVDDYDMRTSDGNNGELKYAKQFAVKGAGGSGITFAGGAQPDSSLDSSEVATADDDDYARQLQFRNPPESTVITWCTNHLSSNKALVLFLAGDVQQIPLARLEQSKWRVRPLRQ